jgi:hypothetical protein
MPYEVAILTLKADGDPSLMGHIRQQLIDDYWNMNRMYRIICAQHNWGEKIV